ncbi:MAG: hypothetical protein ABR953_03550 [Candidatus Acidiferrales bacterium]
MSKVVHWGHWVVAGVFAIKGLGMLYEIIPHFIHALRNQIPFSDQDYLILIPWALYLACAWGILRWRQWGQIFALMLSLLELTAVVTMVAMYGLLSLDSNIVLWSALNCGVVIWLVLPQVRSGYWQRTQTA